MWYEYILQKYEVQDKIGLEYSDTEASLWLFFSEKL